MPKNSRQDGRQGRRRNSFSHDTNLRRRVNTRQEQRAVLIVTNGKETEKKYFKAVRDEPWVTASKVEVTFKNGAPEAVVDLAITEASGYTETWAVCDVDQFEVEGAVTLARRAGVTLTLSNPSFEVWLILHLIKGCGPFDNATKAEERLKELLPTWNKSELDFDDFREGVFQAEDQAKRLAETYGGPPRGNPSTDVWRIIESLHATLSPG